MAFLRKIGKIGGAANKDFTNAIGVDEGPAGKSGGIGMGQAIRKAKSAYQSCVDSGIIDSLGERFPFTSSGTRWAGFTDRVMGGVSSGSLSREQVEGRSANVLRGKVSLANNGGFVQMATDLSLNPSESEFVDASNYDGIELDVLFEGTNEKERYNVHIKNAASQRQFSSYRATFEVDKEKCWQTIRVPWSDFRGYGPGCEGFPLDISTLRRIGVVAIGREMEVYLALGGLRFYSVI